MIQCFVEVLGFFLLIAKARIWHIQAQNAYKGITVRSATECSFKVFSTYRS